MIGLAAYDPEEEDELVLNTAQQRKEAREQQLREEKKEFEIRSTTIKEYFIRMSWKEKRAFLIQLYEKVGSLENLMTVVTFISTAQGKLAAYSDVSPDITFAYDKILSDHDRMLDKNTLERTIERDLDWLASLDEALQIQVGIDLMRIGGGGLIRKMYLPLVRIYNKKIIQNGITKDKRESDLRELFDINYDDDIMYDPTDPASIEVNKQRKRWDEIITKYRSEVEVVTQEKKTDEKKKGKKEKESKLNKKQKGKKTNDEDDIDWFQLLPVWIVKRIFRYLDPKTLTKVSKVNPYWAFAASSVTKERQTRKLLDSTIAKWKSDICSEYLKEQDEIASETKFKKSPKNRRVANLMSRGAILEGMVPRIQKKKLTDHSLITKQDDGITILDDSDEDQITSFPRMIRDEAVLYRQAPCFLKDLELSDIHGESEKSKSNILDTISNQMSSISISVETATMEDW